MHHFHPDDARYRVGMRHDSECYIYLNVKAAVEDSNLYMTHASAVVARMRRRATSGATS